MDDESSVVRTQGKERGQQLGRTKDRERRGSTGRAGRSKAGKRLAGRFFIYELPRCCRPGHHRHQLYRCRDRNVV